MSNLPTPPNEEFPRPRSGLKRPHAANKSLKGTPRSLKRSSIHSHPASPSRDSNSVNGDARHKRVWKACERCRTKKTKCNGEFPCKRCKDDGIICMAGTRKKTEFKVLPPGYGEVLENMHHIMTATVHKIYSMLRNNEPWEFGEPEKNEKGEPVVHVLAEMLGCIRPNNDADLPPHTIFPEDEAGMAELARQIEEHHKKNAANNSNINRSNSVLSRSAYPRARAHRASSSEDAEHSDMDLEFDDYRKATFGGAGSNISLSPSSLSYTYDLEHSPSVVPSDTFTPTTLHSPAMVANPQMPSPATNDYQWLSRPTSAALDMMDMPQMQQFMASQSYNLGADMLGGNVGAMGLGSPLGLGPKQEQQQGPQAFASSCRDPGGVMMGMGADPTIFPGYDEDQLRSFCTGTGNL